jgi:hypothetical protein
MSKQVVAPDKKPTLPPDPVDDSDLSPFAFRVYRHLQRIADPSGQCIKGVRALAAQCRMCVPSAAKARRELIRKGFITSEPVITDEGRFELMTLLEFSSRHAPNVLQSRTPAHP